MKRDRWILLLLLLCLFAQLMAHARTASFTFDEGPHLAVGYATLRSGDLRLQPVHIHPPWANMLAAVPLLFQSDLPDPRQVGGWEIASLSAITDAVVWQYPHPQRLTIAARLPIILMTMLLAAVVFRWASDLFGRHAGLLALFLLVFDPNIIAHGSLVTTDMAVVLLGTATLFLTTRFLRRPHWVTWMGIGVTLGLALASKVSALSLLPVLGILWLLGPRDFPWHRRILSAAGLFLLALVTLWAAYGFEIGSLPGFPLPVPAGTHIAIYRSLQAHYQLGHPSFLLGQNGVYGWWFYFPIAFLLKTPGVTLLLLVVSCLSRLVPRRSPLAARPTRLASRSWIPLALFPLLYVASSLFSSVNIGYRHLLPLLPFLYIFVSHLLAPRLSPPAPRRSPLVPRLTLLTLLGILIIETICLSPHYLAYFNLLAGGPSKGYRYLVDSNLDWGQNLFQLHDWMEAQDIDQVNYAHFSPARPQVYGITAEWLPPDPRAASFSPLNPAPGVYAIGATVLQGVYTPDVNTYAWFRSHEPLARLGHALFLYEVPLRPELAWTAVCADPLPVLSPESVQQGFGLGDLRVIQLDCRRSWVYAPGEGGVVIPAGGEPPPGATLEVTARRVDGTPFYDVYRVGHGGVPPVQTVEGVTVEGPLAFLGYRIDRVGVPPDQVVELWTVWRVETVPGRPLSLMAHLLGADGVPLAGDDGLGVPIEQWQQGDIFVQRHRMVVPEDVPAGEYQLQTGAYWLDTMERWPVQWEDGTLADRILLEAVTVLHQD